MRKLILAAVLMGLAAPAVPAFAEDNAQQDMAEKREKDTLDRQYKNALKAMQGAPASAKSNDPWSSMRAPTTQPEPKR